MEFNDQSQFVVVSHSKRTMERADLLYGVTMPERGVSRRVAVRLEQLDEEGRFRDLESVNREASNSDQDLGESLAEGNSPEAPQSEEPVAQAVVSNPLGTPAVRRATPSRPRGPRTDAAALEAEASEE
jgi:hypothetical protein